MKERISKMHLCNISSRIAYLISVKNEQIQMEFEKGTQSIKEHLKEGPHLRMYKRSDLFRDIFGDEADNMARYYSVIKMPDSHRTLVGDDFIKLCKGLKIEI